ncbi:class I SAM-dependent methyltransferase [Acanthopleuribacter pedis]|uniref:Class I SAM-dependent methyltransferase n=1 Tax=Acanthopleuribacter pedis TaxID=442870 RepID=A0A8J7Q6T9_9BACT|nr:class I SAM-dependent methyltransferase [Acanthopleuribacter pedis]MBO1321622.1 class I SAM-dependent methyltransferase [Acanthopleuribacter pedis]
MNQTMIDDDSHYAAFVEAFIRGRLDLDEAQDRERLLRAAHQQELRLYRFKRKTLPRVSQVLGTLKGLQPRDLLDIGSGRGTFLWPFLETFDGVPVTSVEVDPIRLRDLQAVSKGGVHRLAVWDADVQADDLGENSYDVTTALEVIEHLPNPSAAIRNLVRATRRFVVASVPSKPDDNPEHLHFFPADQFEQMWLAAGAERVDCSYVQGHLIAVIKIA